MLIAISMSFIVIAFLIYMFPLIQVCGDSMLPTFNDGDILIGCRLFSIKKKSVYVFRPPTGEHYVIKRLTQVSPAGKLFFEGDNSDYSYDSRMYGYVSRDKVVAECIFTIHKRKERS